MNHWIILPILLPAVVAPLLAMSVRHDIVLARVFSLGSTVLLSVLGIAAIAVASQGETLTYSLGDWPAPFGIVLVLDRLSALMIALTAILGLCVLLFAISGWDKQGQHFHPLFQFQLMGLNGAFLTGDLFNLFVFFEVLLIASYGLMVHGGGGARVRAGIQYVVINLVGSSIFLIALSLLYGVTGTLNMADFARLLPEIPRSDQALLLTGTTLLMVVFGVKAALFPLQFWLPGTYANTSGPVAALFAIMTKVGVYAIIRLQSLTSDSGLFSPFAGMDWLMPAAAITVAAGIIGILAARSLGQQAAFAALHSNGTLLLAVAVSTPVAHSAALYYLLHSTFAIAVLFLVVDLVIARRSGAGDALILAAPFEKIGLLGAFFFVAVIAVLGMPPLSGFVGKLLVLDSLHGVPAWEWLWGLVLGTSALGIVGFGRSGSLVFWKSVTLEGHLETPRHTHTALPVVAAGSLVALLVLMTATAGIITGYLDATTAQLFDPQSYLDAVLVTMEVPDE